MNGQSLQTKQQNRSEYEPQWKEAKPWKEAQPCSTPDRPTCTPTCTPKKPDCKIPVKPCDPDVVKERNSKETFIFMNSSESTEKTSNKEILDAISRLTWGLLGLASLLFLGSMLMMLFANRPANTTTVREITNNTNKSREVIRVEQADEDPNHYYYPQARW